MTLRKRITRASSLVVNNVYITNGEAYYARNETGKTP